MKRQWKRRLALVLAVLLGFSTGLGGGTSFSLNPLKSGSVASYPTVEAAEEGESAEEVEAVEEADAAESDEPSDEEATTEEESESEDIEAGEEEDLSISDATEEDEEVVEEIEEEEVVEETEEADAEDPSFSDSEETSDTTETEAVEEEAEEEVEEEETEEETEEAEEDVEVWDGEAAEELEKNSINTTKLLAPAITASSSNITVENESVTVGNLQTISSISDNKITGTLNYYATRTAIGNDGLVNNYGPGYFLALNFAAITNDEKTTSSYKVGLVPARGYAMQEENNVSTSHDLVFKVVDPSTQVLRIIASDGTNDLTVDYTLDLTLEKTSELTGVEVSPLGGSKKLYSNNADYTVDSIQDSIEIVAPTTEAPIGKISGTLYESSEAETGWSSGTAKEYFLALKFAKESEENDWYESIYVGVSDSTYLKNLTDDPRKAGLAQLENPGVLDYNKGYHLQKIQDPEKQYFYVVSWDETNGGAYTAVDRYDLSGLVLQKSTTAAKGSVDTVKLIDPSVDYSLGDSVEFELSGTVSGISELTNPQLVLTIGGEKGFSIGSEGYTETVVPTINGRNWTATISATAAEVMTNGYLDITKAVLKDGTSTIVKSLSLTDMYTERVDVKTINWNGVGLAGVPSAILQGQYSDFYIIVDFNGDIKNPTTLTATVKYDANSSGTGTAIFKDSNGEVGEKKITIDASSLLSGLNASYRGRIRIPVSIMGGSVTNASSTDDFKDTIKVDVSATTATGATISARQVVSDDTEVVSPLAEAALTLDNADISTTNNTLYIGDSHTFKATIEPTEAGTDSGKLNHVWVTWTWTNTDSDELWPFAEYSKDKFPMVVEATRDGENFVSSLSLTGIETTGTHAYDGGGYFSVSAKANSDSASATSHDEEFDFGDAVTANHSGYALTVAAPLEVTGGSLAAPTLFVGSESAITASVTRKSDAIDSVKMKWTVYDKVGTATNRKTSKSVVALVNGEEEVAEIDYADATAKSGSTGVWEMKKTVRGISEGTAWIEIRAQGFKNGKEYGNELVIKTTSPGTTVGGSVLSNLVSNSTTNDLAKWIPDGGDTVMQYIGGSARTAKASVSVNSSALYNASTNPNGVENVAFTWKADGVRFNTGVTEATDSVIAATTTTSSVIPVVAPLTANTPCDGTVKITAQGIGHSGANVGAPISKTYKISIRRNPLTSATISTIEPASPRTSNSFEATAEILTPYTSAEADVAKLLDPSDITMGWTIDSSSRSYATFNSNGSTSSLSSTGDNIRLHEPDATHLDANKNQVYYYVARATVYTMSSDGEIKITATATPKANTEDSTAARGSSVTSAQKSVTSTAGTASISSITVTPSATTTMAVGASSGTDISATIAQTSGTGSMQVKWEWTGSDVDAVSKTAKVLSGSTPYGLTANSDGTWTTTAVFVPATDETAAHWETAFTAAGVYEDSGKFKATAIYRTNNTVTDTKIGYTNEINVSGPIESVAYKYSKDNVDANYYDWDDNLSNVYIGEKRYVKATITPVSGSKPSINGINVTFTPSNDSISLGEIGSTSGEKSITITATPVDRSSNVVSAANATAYEARFIIYADKTAATSPVIMINHSAVAQKSSTQTLGKAFEGTSAKGIAGIGGSILKEIEIEKNVDGTKFYVGNKNTAAASPDDEGMNKIEAKITNNTTSSNVIDHVKLTWKAAKIDGGDVVTWSNDYTETASASETHHQSINSYDESSPTVTSTPIHISPSVPYDGDYITVTAQAYSSATESEATKVGAPITSDPFNPEVRRGLTLGFKEITLGTDYSTKWENMIVGQTVSVGTGSGNDVVLTAEDNLGADVDIDALLATQPEALSLSVATDSADNELYLHADGNELTAIAPTKYSGDAMTHTPVTISSKIDGFHKITSLTASGNTGTTSVGATVWQSYTKNDLVHLEDGEAVEGDSTTIWLNGTSGASITESIGFNSAIKNGYLNPANISYELKDNGNTTNLYLTKEDGTTTAQKSEKQATAALTLKPGYTGVDFKATLIATVKQSVASGTVSPITFERTIYVQSRLNSISAPEKVTVQKGSTAMIQKSEISFSPAFLSNVITPTVSSDDPTIASVEEVKNTSGILTGWRVTGNKAGTAWLTFIATKTAADGTKYTKTSYPVQVNVSGLNATVSAASPMNVIYGQANAKEIEFNYTDLDTSKTDVSYKFEYYSGDNKVDEADSNIRIEERTVSGKKTYYAYAMASNRGDTPVTDEIRVIPTAEDYTITDASNPSNDYIEIRVNAYSPLPSTIVLDKTTASMAGNGSTIDVGVKDPLSDSEGLTYSWSTKGSSYLSVSAGGTTKKATFKAVDDTVTTNRTATIELTVSRNITGLPTNYTTATCEVTIYPYNTAPVSAGFNESELTLLSGETYNTDSTTPLTATLVPAGSANTTWTWTAYDSEGKLIDQTASNALIAITAPTTAGQTSTATRIKVRSGITEPTTATIQATIANAPETFTPAKCTVTILPAVDGTVSITKDGKAATEAHVGGTELLATFAPTSEYYKQYYDMEWSITSTTGSLTFADGSTSIKSKELTQTLKTTKSNGTAVVKVVMTPSKLDAVTTDNITKQATLSVKQVELDKVVVSPENKSISQGETLRIEVKAQNEEGLDATNAVISESHVTTTSAGDNVTGTGSDVLITDITEETDTGKVYSVYGTLNNTLSTITFTATQGTTTKTATATVSVKGSDVSVTDVVVYANGNPTGDKETIFLNHTKGSVMNLSAVLAPVGATNQNVVWYSTNTSVASFESNGLSAKLTANGTNGTTYVYVITEDGGISKSVAVRVEELSLSGASLGSADEILANNYVTTDSIAVGGSTELKVSAIPAGAAISKVEWTSSDEAVAKVSGSEKDGTFYGTVSGVAAGAVRITAKAYREDGEVFETGKFVVNVSANAPTIQKIFVDTKEAALAIGDAGISVKATVYPSGADASKITWTPGFGNGTYVELSNTTGATTKITAKAATETIGGFETITLASSDGGVLESADSVKVTVPTIDAARVALTLNGKEYTDGASITLPVGTTLAGAATVYGSGKYEATEQGVAWSQTGSIATISTPSANQTNVVLSSTPATGTVTVVSAENSAVKTTVNITTKYVLADSGISVAAGGTYDGKAKTPAVTVKYNGATVAASNYDVAYKNNVNAGTGSVTVTGKGDYQGSFTKTFTIAKANTAQTTSKAAMTIVGTNSATRKGAGANITGFTYKSSKPAVATVDKNGKVVGKTVGSTTITVSAKAANGNFNAPANVSYTVKVTKTKKPSIKKPSTKSRTVTAKWAKVSGATGYVVQIATKSNFKKGLKTATIKKASTTSYKFKKLTKGTKYYVRVYAYVGNTKAANKSAASSKKSIKCK